LFIIVFVKCLWPADCLPSKFLLFDTGEQFLASSSYASKIYHLFIGVSDCLQGLFGINCSDLFIKSCKEGWNSSCVWGIRCRCI